MSRTFCVPGVFFLFSAFVLLFITSVSLPYLSAMDITRTHFETGSVAAPGSSSSISQIRVSFHDIHKHKKESYTDNFIRQVWYLVSEQVD